MTFSKSGLLALALVALSLSPVTASPLQRYVCSSSIVDNFKGKNAG